MALATWTLVHESGVHATVAGVLLAFAVPVERRDRPGRPDAGSGLAEHFEHRFRPISAGIATATWLVARLIQATLDEGLSWADVVGLALLGGIGFTVSLLIGELAFGLGTDRDGHVKIAVLAGSLAATVLAAVILRVRDRSYRRIRQSETDAP